MRRDLVLRYKWSTKLKLSDESKRGLDWLLPTNDNRQGGSGRVGADRGQRQCKRPRTDDHRRTIDLMPTWLSIELGILALVLPLLVGLTSKLSSLSQNTALNARDIEHLKSDLLKGGERFARIEEEIRGVNVCLHEISKGVSRLEGFLQPQIEGK